MPRKKTVAEETVAVIPRMLFLVMKFRQGLNITVRLGTKWSGYTGPVEVARTEKGVARPGMVVDTLFFGQFEELYESVLLRLEHDPACTNFFNLVKAMQRAYPGDHVKEIEPFTRTSPVTVVFFTVDKDE